MTSKDDGGGVDYDGAGGQTVADDEEDEGLVAEQPEDGGRVGVLVWGDAASRGLGLGRWKLRALLEHWHIRTRQKTLTSRLPTVERGTRTDFILILRKLTDTLSTSYERK